MANPPQTQKAGPGRPKGGANAPKDPIAAKAQLQHHMDRMVGLIADKPGVNFPARVRKAQKAGVPRETALRAFSQLEAAMVDAKAAIDRIYREPESRPTLKSRVVL